ncbi:MAG: hypothetical protein AAGH15_14770 [Myxococcota bacterium]
MLDFGPPDAGDLGGADAGSPDQGAPDAGPDMPDLGAPDAGLFPALPEAHPGLPDHRSAVNGRFATRESCQVCHVSDGVALTDQAGRDVSMSTLWRASMMSFSGRDPYFLAALSHEIAVQPEAETLIASTCTRCHAPAGHETLRPSGAHLDLEALTGSVETEALLGREGVTCTVCHQIDPENLGTDESFSGGWRIGGARTIYGPFEDPVGRDMQLTSGYTPVFGPHMRDSAQCATCHTLFTRALDEAGAPTGPTFPEQVPYLEWRNSSYQNERGAGPLAASCQTCHVPQVDEDGMPIEAPLSVRPAGLASRTPIGRHVFVGANAYMLELIADQWSWVGTPVAPEEIRDRAELTRTNLRSAAELRAAPRRDRNAMVVEVKVANLTGHKLPTAYPSRRVWVRLEVLDAEGEVLWASGRTDARGALVDGMGRRLDAPGADLRDEVLPHLDLITREDQVQVYEARMGDAAGRPTRVLLEATQYLKDDRILPAGWVADGPEAEWTAPVGVAEDADFVAGGDALTYRFPWPDGAARVRVALLYQSVPPGAVEGLRDRPTPLTAAFVAFTEERPATPEILAEVDVEL